VGTPFENSLSNSELSLNVNLPCPSKIFFLLKLPEYFWPDGHV
jgi:hypothetical protein